MTHQQAIEIVTEFQKWRRGEPPYDFGTDGVLFLEISPTDIGIAIDILLEIAKNKPCQTTLQNQALKLLTREALTAFSRN